MPPAYFPLRWESTGDQWWFASPIDWAAANGHYDLVRELLQLDTNLLIKLTSLPRIRRLETVWDDQEQFDDVAKCRAEVAKKLLLECETKKGHNTLIRAGYGGWLLYTASSAGDVEFVKDLLERDPLLVFGEGEYGVSDVLYAAARSRSSEVFRILLEAALSPRGCGSTVGEDVCLDFRWEIMNRAVHAAARGGNVEFLREHLGDCDDVLVYRDALGSTILHTAAGRGQVEVVKDLLSMFNIIDSTDNEGNSALHVAAYRGHLSVVEILVSASQSLALLKNNYGDTFLHMAVAGFRTPGFRRLDQQTNLMEGLVRGDVVDLREIINVRNNDGRTALHMAVVENNQSDLVELVMSVPWIDLNVRDEDGNTPLDLLKQGPRSASSEILIKRFISAGGISNCEDNMTRSALVSHLKMQVGMGGSPGASFRIPDAEIFLYSGIDNESDSSSDLPHAEFTSCSGPLSHCVLGSGSNSLDGRKPHSVNKAAKRLKMLLQWPKRKEKKADDASSFLDDISVDSYGLCAKLENNPIPLRQRFARMSSLPNNKRLSVLSNLPSPNTKLKFSAGLMHGVIQLMPQSSLGSPSSPFSDSSWASPGSFNREKDTETGDASLGPSSSKMKRRGTSLNMRMMNQYLCFGAQGLAVEESIKARRHKG